VCRVQKEKKLSLLSPTDASISNSHVTRQRADMHYGAVEHNEQDANPLKFAGVPQTTKLVSAASGPKFTVLWGHVEDILLLNRFFPIVDMCLSCEDVARQSCVTVPRWQIFGDFLGPAFPASCAHHVSDLHLR